MKILTSSQIKQVERSTLTAQHISSWDLMERAAERLTDRFTDLFSPTSIFIAVGSGGNGGDGLAMARMLSIQGYSVRLLMLFDIDRCSLEYQKNFELLPFNIETTMSVNLFMEWMQQEHHFVMIDAIFGISYTIRPYRDDIEKLILYINHLNRDSCSVVSIDTPSGLGSEIECVNQLRINADHTLTIYSPKLPMLMPSYGECVGELSVINIDYCNEAIDSIKTNLYYTDNISSLIPKRKRFAHKGNFGSLLIIGSGNGMFGASIIAARGAEAVGCGVITIFTPHTYEAAIYSNIPSAMILPTDETYFAKCPNNIERYSAVCVGVGMGKEVATIGSLSELFLKCNAELIPMVIDADAINLVSENLALLHLIPEGSILTPHVGEFRRLVGSWSSETEKLEKLSQLSKNTACTIVLKGAYTAVATPSGDIHFNSTGNPAMSRAASGDMLSGVVAAILARGISHEKAAIVGVFLHGEAADRATTIYGENFVTIDRWLSSFHE